MNRSYGKVECDFCHKFDTLVNAGKLGWKWFTGYNTKTTHICAACVKQNPREVERLFKQSRNKVPNA